MAQEQRSAPERSLRLAHLYPTLMNIYGDRGNIACLRLRCELRGVQLEVDELGIDADLDPGRYDLVFLGGGQDREQRRLSRDLMERKAAGLRAAVEHQTPVLTVCGGYQLMGHYYQAADGERLPGLGIFDAVTIHPGEAVARCIGNVEVAWERGGLVGFENHGGRTYLGAGARPLGQVTAGFGNNGEDGTEGCRYGNAFGTYLHGSLLPKNPDLADLLLRIALERKYGDGALTALDDSLEAAAHSAASAIARQDAASRARGRAWHALRLRGALRRIGMNLRPRPQRETGA